MSSSTFKYNDQTAPRRMSNDDIETLYEVPADQSRITISAHVEGFLSAQCLRQELSATQGERLDVITFNLAVPDTGT